jgi:hypothetical protein
MPEHWIPLCFFLANESYLAAHIHCDSDALELMPGVTLPHVIVHDIRQPVAYAQQTAAPPAPQSVREPRGGGQKANQNIHEIAAQIIAAGQSPPAGRGWRTKLAKRVQQELKTHGIHRRIDTIRRALPALPKAGLHSAAAARDETSRRRPP